MRMGGQFVWGNKPSPIPLVLSEGSNVSESLEQRLTWGWRGNKKLHPPKDNFWNSPKTNLRKTGNLEVILKISSKPAIVLRFCTKSHCFPSCKIEEEQFVNFCENNCHFESSKTLSDVQSYYFRKLPSFQNRLSKEPVL